MAVNVAGAIAVVVFYIIILVSGIIAGRKTSQSQTNESVLVADRSLGGWVSVFTITASMVGGAFINGCAESVAAYGLIYMQAPIGYSLSFIISGFFFAPKMRIEEYVTLFDPFQLKYGKKVGALLFVPQFFGDLFWAAGTLSALGATISIILDIDSTLAIIVSAIVAIFYTFFGGLYAVAYTDVFQLVIIGVGLIIAFPFSLAHPAVSFDSGKNVWGELPLNQLGSYIDVWLLCLGGGIPWQALYQRVLACKTTKIAKWATIISFFPVIILATPCIVLGVAGAAADWNQTSYDGTVPLSADQYTYILPLSLNYLTPSAVSIVGIGALAAAVMSSADSCILSSASVFSKNIYADILRPKASQREIIWVIRISVIVFGGMSTVVAISVKTVYGLYVLCGDLMYVVLLPQLVFILWMPWTNVYGCVTSFFVSFILRIFSGESVIGLPAVIQYPWYDEEYELQHFPHRTFVMLLGCAVFVLVSLLTNYLFFNEIIPLKYDVLKCHKRRTIHRVTRENMSSPGKDVRESVMEKNDLSKPMMEKNDVSKPMIEKDDEDEDDKL